MNLKIAFLRLDNFYHFFRILFKALTQSYVYEHYMKERVYKVHRKILIFIDFQVSIKANNKIWSECKCDIYWIKRALKCILSYYSSNFSEKFIILHSFNVLLLNIAVVIANITILIYSTSRKYLNCLETRKSYWVA